MNTGGLIDKFNKWNPMENDYKNTEFNHYISGPGANIEAELQPAQQALQKSCKVGEKQPVPTLIFKNLPVNMTTRAMHHLCSRYGSVKEVRDSTKNNYYFVDLATVADMEAVFRALEHNNFGFEIMIGKNNKRSDITQNQSYKNFSPVPPRSTGIDYESRNLRTSKKNHPRPKVMEDTLVNARDAANTGLPLNLFTSDAHSLERQDLDKLANNNKFEYHHGRSYVNMPEKTKQFVAKKHEESIGSYNETEDKYVHNVEKVLMPNSTAKCSHCFYTCDTVCERCSQYYCSVECQKNDWPYHRYICGIPKHLQRAPPFEKEDQTENNISEMTKEKMPAVTEIVEKKTLNETYTELPKPSKRIPKQLSSQQLQNSVKSAPLQLENILKAPSQQIAKSYKKLPAALTTMKQTPKSSEEPVQELPSFSKSPTEQLSKSSTVIENNSNKTAEMYKDTYKQNMPRSGNIVTITAICKTNVVFIRSTTYDSNLSYLNTVDTLQSLGKMLQPLKTLPKSGMVVIAKFEEQFNRALILKVSNPTKIVIHFMDYGNMEEAKIEDLYEAPKELIYKPRHAIPVVLRGVTDCYMTQEIRKFMHSYLNNVNVEIRYKQEDFQNEMNVFEVELIDESTQQNVNKMIMKLSKPTEPQNINEICDRDYLEQKVFPGGKNVEFIVMDNSLMCSGCISCTTKPYAIEIEKFKRDIQAYVESIPKEPYTPRVQELCIAQYSEDGLWYRGLCLEKVGDGYPSIHFIDYGNITLVPIENIRRYPRQFTYPIYTVDCGIEGMPEFCDDELVEKLEHLIPNGELIKCETVTVDKENNFYTLTLPNIIKELKKCGLIENDQPVI